MTPSYTKFQRQQIRRYVALADQLYDARRALSERITGVSVPGQREVIPGLRKQLEDARTAFRQARDVAARHRGHADLTSGITPEVAESHREHAKTIERDALDRVHEIECEIARIEAQIEAMQSDVQAAARFAEALLRYVGLDRDTLAPVIVGQAPGGAL